MRVVVQRVSEARVEIGGAVHAAIGPGLAVLAGFRPADGEADLEWMARKIVGLRIFPDAEGLLNLDLGAMSGGLLVVPNFTLYGDCRKGRRPSFTEAAPPEAAAALFEQFLSHLQAQGAEARAGVFGAHMHVHLVNDGPITLLLDSDKQ